MFGVAFPKILLIQPVVPLFEGVEGTVAHPMGCPTVPRGSFRHELKKKNVVTDTIRKLDLELARYSKLISTLPQGVDTIGIQLTDSDLLLVLMRSLPEAVKTFAVHHSRGDSYQAYRESARRREQQQRLFVEHMTNQSSSHSKNKLVNEVSHDGWQSEAQGDSSGTQWYSLEDDWSSESWHVDAVSSSTSVKCQRCGSRKHATESCQADLSRTKCFRCHVNCTRSVMFVGTSVYVFPKTFWIKVTFRALI